jgi:hypothetical protein
MDDNDSKPQLRHDTFFKKSLSIPKLARQFLQMHLPAKLQKMLNFKTLTKQPDSFVETNLNKQITDVLFSCNTVDDQQIFIYLLCEHQSSPDYWMSMRLLKYMIAICENYREQNPDAKLLPLVYPLVFYNGTQTHNAPLNFHELFTHPDIARNILRNEYHLIDASKIDDEELKEKAWAGVMQFFMKHAFERDVIKLLQQMSLVLTKIVKTSYGYDYFLSILWYNLNKLQLEDQQQLTKLLAQITDQQTTENIMGTLVQSWVEKGVEQGISQGIAMTETRMRIEMAKKMLEENEPFEKISRFTGLSYQEIQQLQNTK